ncbi:phosphoenolpyruvate carboxylase [Proteobacteria bacterium 005FR1]|nr:phosphoenolpyruvate carboxylase [Proteobacteria bacterium 005FR1]
MLGRMLGDTIARSEGQALLDQVEHVRQLAKAYREGVQGKRAELIDYLATIEPESLVIVARAFNQFLNLANIAEQLHSTLNADNKQLSALSSLSEQITWMLEEGVGRESLLAAIENLHIDLVLTAHPTEITRRTLIEKQSRIYNYLLDLQTRKLDEESLHRTRQGLAQQIAQWWHTDEIRTEKPTPVDEAIWGFAVIENSLWEAVPLFLNKLGRTVKKQLDYDLPITYHPIHFTSWMGGDRDGNPNVTARITREVLLLARWKAADLFLGDINGLISELSMNRCSDAVSALVGEQREPYRAVLKEVRSLLQNTLQYTDDLLKGREPQNSDILSDDSQLWEPLYACYRSLHDCGMGIIADGKLRDTLRRVRCFGVHLLRLDIRQESSRHTQVFGELTRYLEIGDYESWSEQERIEFLSAELENKRPLFPRRWEPSDAVREVLDTFAMIGEQPQQALGAYIISMAHAPSDVLGVQLLLREFGCRFRMQVAPLFETLDDLNNAAEVIEQLLATPSYRNRIENRQMVMIGYSDSAKDAGVMAASWAQYRAQEALLEVAKNAGVQLTLFHGRGGTIGRGGAPAHAALLSQPPGSLENGLRVTEQGEMIRFKLGLPQIAVTSFGLYTSAMLQSNLLPPPNPKPEWRELLDQLSDISSTAYRKLVRENPDFLAYFRSSTPINELSKLSLGSRPAKRRQEGGIESLRAIPWIFAWSQNRLMLPAWYGAGDAIEQLVRRGKRQELEKMCDEWPFFSTRISMLEMVFAKADPDLSTYYDSRLVEERLQPLGAVLRDRLRKDIEVVLSIANDENLLQGLPWLKESVRLRNTYTDPLNLLQVELLHRDRGASSPVAEKALMVTIAGIAAGMRNTG